MSRPTDEGMSTIETGDETQGLTGLEQLDINSASSSSSTLVTSEEVAWQIKAAADLLTKQLK